MDGFSGQGIAGVLSELELRLRNKERTEVNITANGVTVTHSASSIVARLPFIGNLECAGVVEFPSFTQHYLDLSSETKVKPAVSEPQSCVHSKCTSDIVFLSQYTPVEEALSAHPIVALADDELVLTSTRLCTKPTQPS